MTPRYAETHCFNIMSIESQVAGSQEPLGSPTTQFPQKKPLRCRHKFRNHGRGLWWLIWFGSDETEPKTIPNFRPPYTRGLVQMCVHIPPHDPRTAFNVPLGRFLQPVPNSLSSFGESARVVTVQGEAHQTDQRRSRNHLKYQCIL